MDVSSYQNSPAHNDLVYDDLVHESDRTRVTRVFLPTGVVVRKEPLGPDAQRRLQREVAMLDRVYGVAGVAQLVQGAQDSEAIWLEDAGDRALGSLAAPLAADDLVGLAVQLARAVAEMHRRGVIHRDIAPANNELTRP